ncbi:MAG: hypothetical protein JWN76_2101 [Chitinophagaceae bacterium]|nr:hypothetical protein [Chitinophagaceae bacterium]
MNSLTKNRIQSVDLLRGLVMIIMALDHTRDYFHSSAQLYPPLDLSHTSAAIFLTRWITHFCAPVFMFLAGTSAYLVGQRKSKKELSFFLLTRGLWLMFLDLSVIGFGWTFNIHFPAFFFDTLWALGVSMVALSIFIHLPFKVILALGIIISAGHNLLDNFHVQGNNLLAFLWGEVHDQRIFKFGGYTLMTAYPVLSWIGIIALGYCFGALYKNGSDPVKRKRSLLLLGSSAIILFILLRVANLYGDQQLWSAQKSGLFTFLSFINVTKYPPSLLYTLVTLGPAIIFLAFAEKPLNKVTSVISLYGRVPMFYYLLHIYLIHLMAMAAAQLTGFGWKSMIVDDFPEVKGFGFSLGIVYLIWIGVVLVLYSVCKSYDKYKTAHKEKWWLSYL